MTIHTLNPAAPAGVYYLTTVSGSKYEVEINSHEMTIKRLANTAPSTFWRDGEAIAVLDFSAAEGDSALFALTGLGVEPYIIRRTTEVTSITKSEQA